MTVITVSNCNVPFNRRIVDDGVKENGFSIITENRTYHIIAENTNDWKWVALPLNLKKSGRCREVAARGGSAVLKF